MSAPTNLRPLALAAFFLFVNTLTAQSGKALSLDGINDYMEVADHDDLDINAGENFTLTLWVKTSQSANYYRIVSKRAAGSGPGYEMITQTGAGAFGMNLRSVSNVNAGPPFGATSITDGAWHHLAMVVDAGSGSSSIFVDGLKEQTANSTAIGTEGFENAVSLLLGVNGDQSIFMNALIDNVRLWQAALTDNEILDDMIATVSGAEPNLIAAWDFETVSGTTVSDVKGMRPGTLHGGANTVDINAPVMTYQESTVMTTSLPVGMGEKNERVIGVKVTTQGSNSPLNLTQIQFNLAGTSNLADLENLKVYYTAGNPRLSTANLFGTATVQSGTIQASGSQTLQEGLNHFWITCDVSASAQEGDVIKGALVSVTVGGQAYTPAAVSTNDARPILLENKRLFSGGDFGSQNWRIPAITTAADGSLIVAADARINGPGDLPGNIDIAVRRSTDRGETWSNAQTIADFGTSGASDPALVLDRNTGNLLCMFASHVGLFQSTPGNPIRFQVCRSQDNGQTWSAPQEFTNQIYNPAWSAAWLASGNAHQLRSGRIVGAVGVRQTPANALSNFMIYSDDGGASWNYKPTVASTVGDEAKIVELDNGNLMMNIRNQTPNLRRIVVSTDGGDTWGAPTFQPELIDPFVNGDFIRYTSVLDGYEKSRLLFSIAAHPTTRQNLTVFLSYDEGGSWPVSKTIYPGPAAYSSLTVLDDGTIGCFYEDGEYEEYELYFARFSLNWLTNGNDSWLPPASVSEKGSDFLKVKISPNPAAVKTTLEMELKQSELLSGTLFNEKGMAVDSLFRERFSTGVHQKQLDLSHLPNGNYFLEIKSGNKVLTRKMIVLK